MNDQRSLTDQLKDLIPVATERGLYDAADYLKKQVEERSDNPKAVECQLCHNMDDDHDPCFPYQVGEKREALIAHSACAKWHSSRAKVDIFSDGELIFRRGQTING